MPDLSGSGPVLTFMALAILFLAADAVRTRRLLSRLRREGVRQREEETAEKSIASDPLPLLTFTLDAQGRFERFNPRWLEAFGVSESELKALRFVDLIPAGELAAWRDIERSLLSGEPSHRFELSLLARTGQPVFVEGAVWPRDLTGLPGLAGSLVDVTSRRQAERARVQAEESFHRYFLRNPAATCRSTGDGRLLDCNESFVRLLGFASREEALATPAVALHAVAEDRAQLLKTLRREGFLDNVEIRLRRRDGSVVTVLGSVSLARTADGTEILESVALDLTPRLEAERRFRQFLEASGDMIQSVTADGKLEYVNRQWKETLGYTDEEVRHLALSDFVAAREIPHCLEILDRLRSGEACPVVETVFVTRDGQEIHVQGTLSASFKDDRFLSCQGFFRNVNRNKALEEQRRTHLEQIQQQNLELALRRNEAVRANRLKSEFLATVSHELRTPLNAIIGFSELLADNPEEPLSEKQAFHLSFVRQASDHLLRLINDVLDLSKIEAGRLKLAPASFPVSGLLPEVLSTIAPLASQKQIRVEQSMPDALSVYADRLHLKQIFFNLLSNAVKFTPAGGTIAVQGESAPGFLLLTIRNTGSTIDPADRETIFDEFQQARQAVGGTGLGLAIVRRLVELNGGRIWVESSPSATVFVVLLPDRPALLTPGPAASRALPQAQRVSGEAPILIISDGAADRDRWAEALQRQSFRVAAAGLDGDLSPIPGRQPQLILLDLATTGAAGWKLLGDLLALGDADRPLVVALVPDLARQRAAFLAGADGCLILPVDDEVLIKACRRRIEPLDAPRVVLIVDADPERQRLLAEAVMVAGLRPAVAASGKEALQTASRIQPHALLLDIRLPDLDAYQTVVRLRSNPATAEVPVFVLARKSAEAVETQLLTGPTRLLWLAEEGDPEFLKIEVQRMLSQEAP